MCPTVLRPQVRSEVSTVSSITQLSTTSTVVLPKKTLREEIGNERLYAIFKCESGLRQFGKDNKTLISSTKDLGIAQIHYPIWEKQAIKMGLDIRNNVHDNITMAKYIFSIQGYSAWTCNNLI